MAVPPLFYNLYNPSSWESWCTPTPLICTVDETGETSETCVRGEHRMYKLNQILVSALFGLVFLIVITTLVMICVRVVKVNRQYLLVKVREENRLISAVDSVADSMHHQIKKQSITEKIRKNHEVTKTVLIQALVYFLAFFLTLVFPLIQLAGLHKEGAHWPNYLELIFMPMQGFFNFLIFIYFKVANYRRMHTGASTKEILRLFFLGKAIEPLEISRISLLKFDEEQRMLEVDIYSEIDEEYLRYAMVPASVETENRVDFRFLMEKIDDTSSHDISSKIGYASDSEQLDGPPSCFDRDIELDDLYGRVTFSSVASSQGRELPHIHEEFSSNGDLSGLKSTSSFPSSSIELMSSKGDLSGLKSTSSFPSASTDSRIQTGTRVEHLLTQTRTIPSAYVGDNLHSSQSMRNLLTEATRVLESSKRVMYQE
mmetsp:Transcript_22483/g.27561  ORF Transcript_22483/g.27561 Transcript_22483/m.27561 type:complete len:428 (-) Transcript_22483:236-1519(-)